MANDTIAHARASAARQAPRSLPLFWIAVVVLGVGAFFMPRFNASHPAELVARVVLALALCAAGSAIEHKLFTTRRARAASHAAGSALVLLVAGLVVALLGWLAVLAWAHASTAVGMLGMAVSVAGIWLSSTALGTLMAMPLSSPRPSWSVRFRITAAIGIAIGVTAALVAAAPRGIVPLATRLSQTARTHVGSGTGLADFKFMALLPQAGTGWLLVASTAIVLLVGFPMVLSATTKLADEFVVQLSELSDVVRALAEGRTRARARIGGSPEQRAIARSVNELVDTFEQTQRIQHVFGPQTGPVILELLKVAHPPTAAMSDAIQEASVLVSEVRDLPEEIKVLGPAESGALLGAFFEQLSAVIAKYEGYLHRLTADSVVVVFNGPIAQNDHAARAARCAIELMTELVALNRSEQFGSIGKIGISIGIASGPISISSSHHATPRYMVFGPTVELAFALARVAPPGHVLVNDGNAEYLPMYMPSVTLAQVVPPGYKQSVTPHRVWPPP
jgi:class 3 adenylate cyclase